MGTWTDQYLHELILPSTTTDRIEKINGSIDSDIGLNGSQRENKRKEKEMISGIKTILEGIFSKQNIRAATLTNTADLSLQNMHKSIDEIDEELEYNAVYRGGRGGRKDEAIDKYNLIDPTRRKVIRAKYFLDML